MKGFCCLIILMISTYSPLVLAADNHDALISIVASPYSKMMTDKDEDNRFYTGPASTKYDFEFGDGLTARYINASGLPFYAAISSHKVRDEAKQGDLRYSNLSVGYAAKYDGHISRDMNSYLILGLGAGAARFQYREIDDTEYRALGEIFTEVGVRFNQSISVGVGIKSQIIGYPGDTLAYNAMVDLSVGYWF